MNKFHVVGAASVLLVASAAPSLAYTKPPAMKPPTPVVAQKPVPPKPPAVTPKPVPKPKP